MLVLHILLVVFAVVAALTKIIDIVTTIRSYNRFKAIGCKDPVELEQNPIGRWLFRRLGVVGGGWFTFAVVTLVIGASCAEIILMDDAVVLKCGVLLFYLLLIWGHISAGIFNTSGRQTPIVRVIRFLYTKIGR